MQPYEKSDREVSFEREFLSNEEHRAIRTITQILSWTQPLAESDEGCMEYLEQVCSKADKAQQDSQHKLLNSFLRSIDGEGSEAIALLPGGFTPGGLALFAGGSQRSLDESASVDNQQEGKAETKPSNGPQNGLEETGVSKDEICRVAFTRYEIPSNFVHDPLSSFFDLLEKRGGEVPPALTLQLNLVLLKHGQAQVGKEARHRAFEDFNLFMTCVGLDRLRERFEFGATSRNFYQFIRLLGKDEPTPHSLYDAVRRLDSPRADEDPLGNAAHLTKHKRRELKTLLRKLGRRRSREIDYTATRFFYTVLYVILKRLKNMLNGAMKHQPPKGQRVTFDRAAFRAAIRALKSTVHLLWYFVTHFREEIQHTLRWVARICEVNDGACQSSKDGGEKVHACLEGEVVEPLDEIRRKRNWPEACLQWLELLVAQQCAIREIHMWAPSRTYKSKSLRQLVPRAKIHTIQFRSALWDRESHDMSPIRQKLEQGAWIERIYGEALVKWLEQNGHTEDLDAARFTGSVHCETMLLTLHALAAPWLLRRRSPEKISECLRSRRITVPPQVISKLRAGREVLALSRRCCPGCRIVALAIQGLGRGSQRISAPSFHRVWLPMALPPWTPRRIGLALLAEMENELRRRGELAFDAVQREDLRRESDVTCESDFDCSDSLVREFEYWMALRESDSAGDGNIRTGQEPHWRLRRE